MSTFEDGLRGDGLCGACGAKGLHACTATSIKREIGFTLSYVAQVDTENQDQVQMHANAPVGATAQDLAAVIATMRNAAWLERLACNERIQARATLLKDALDTRVAEFRADGKVVDQEMIDEEEATVNTVIAKQEAKLDVDRALAGLVGMPLTIAPNGSGAI